MSKNYNYGNRGMSLEKDIDLTNEYYLQKNIALIYKKPTSVTIKKAIYPEKRKIKIIDGYFNKPSTTDYNGLCNGYYIDFEAKETKSLTSFPLANIHAHQLKHLSRVCMHKGIAFLIVSFTRLDKIFIVLYKDIEKYLSTNNRKSLPISFFDEFGKIIKISYTPRLDYLKYINFEKGELYE